jgi:hypothetical protein
MVKALSLFIALALLASCTISGWLTYTSTTYQFQFQYPPGSTIESETLTDIRIQLPITPGTNLAEKFLDVHVEQGGIPCLSPYSPPVVGAVVGNQTVNGIYWTIEQGSEGAAGSLYQWKSYSTYYPESYCVTLSFVLHSQNPELFETPPPAFNQGAESLVFASIVSTFVFLGLPAATPPPAATSTPTAAPAPGGFFFVPRANLDCLLGPDPVFHSITLAMQGQSYPIDGRNLQNTWLRLMVTPAVGCWVPADSGTPSGDTSQARVLSEIPTPTFTPPPPGCSQYADEKSCERQPACTWNAGQRACQNK